MGNIQGLPKPEVETLTIDVSQSVCPALFDSLFRCCHPIYVTWSPQPYYIRKHGYNEFVYKVMFRN
ncbi:hypothetical protein ACS0TY_022376 [Phlomoides rotata]